MAGLFNSVLNIGKGVIQRMQAPADPYLVKPINPAELSSVSTQDRHECLIFYGPRVSKREAEDAFFELVVHSEKGYSWRYEMSYIKIPVDGINYR